VGLTGDFFIQGGANLSKDAPKAEQPMVERIDIANFRGIKNDSFTAKALTMFVGNNGTGKSSALEAVHFALTQRLSNSKLKHTDFYEGTDDPIKIMLTFSKPFTANLPDGFSTKKIACNRVYLEASKRQKATSGKAFSEPIVLKHLVLPVIEKGERGWSVPRTSRDKPFEFDERMLTMPQVELENFPRSFYFAKDRGKQLKRGFNSSISTVLEDFNWRFARSVRKEEVSVGDTFFERKASWEEEIRGKLDEEILEKSLNALNDKLTMFNLEKIGLSIIDGHAPFDYAFLTKQFQRLDLPVDNLGSGVEMLIALLFLETLASLSKESLVVIIDEPELHLHPHLQEQFAQYLRVASATNQVLVSTHSPYFYKELVRQDGVELVITKHEEDKISITNTGHGYGLIPWGPTWGELNHVAYGLPTIEFHDELYGRLHELFVEEVDDENERTKRASIWEFDKYLQNLIHNCHIRSWTPEYAGKPKTTSNVTLQSFIRNKVHHPENASMQPQNFTHDDLRLSISQMIELISATTPTL
jgi:energy-coupling factor transporter ATP-binding protein EcfA2